MKKPLKKKGGKKNYTVKVCCLNCDFGEAYLSMYSGKIISVLVGKKLKDLPCPKCGCKELIKYGRVSETAYA